MKPQRRYIQFRQSFKSPFFTTKGVWKERRSLILRQDDEEGNISFGEVAPLAGHTNLNLDTALEEARKWSQFKGNIEDFSQLRPAITSLQSEIWQETLPSVPLPATARLWGMNEAICNRIIKRKIGLQPPEEEMDSVSEWLQTLPDGAQVRLDPNESLSREGLLRWIDRLNGDKKVQFIEQPTGAKNDEWLIEFSKESPIPIALDEALYRMENKKNMLSLPKQLFWVIKPILFTEWSIFFDLFSEADRKLIFSTSFESPFGYEAVLRLSINSPHSPGLERSCFHGNPHEFPEHHQPVLMSPGVTNEKLSELWDSLSK